MMKKCLPSTKQVRNLTQTGSAKTIESVLEGGMLVPRVVIVQLTTSPNIDLPKIHGNVGYQAAAIDL